MPSEFAIPDFPITANSSSAKSRILTMSATGNVSNLTLGITILSASCKNSSFVFTATLWITGLYKVSANLWTSSFETVPERKVLCDVKTPCTEPNFAFSKSSMPSLAVVPTLSVTPGRNPISTTQSKSFGTNVFL